MSEGEVKKTIRSRRGGDRNRLSINILELLEMVMTAYAMIVIKKDRPVKEGNSVLMRGDSSSAVQWVISCGRGKGEERSGGVMKIIGSWSG